MPELTRTRTRPAERRSPPPPDHLVRIESPRARHGRSLAVLLGLAVWLMRNVLMSSRLPAGTDMLGFITRAQENAAWQRVLSPWAPSVLGAPRLFTLDNLLGLATLGTGHPVVTVRLFACATLFASGAFAYLLSWRWYQNRSSALLAGILYMGSQASISRWASAQLNVEMIVASAPLLVYLWSACVERYTFRRAAAFGLAAGLLMWIRADMIAYALPFLALYVVVQASMVRRPIATLTNAARTIAVAAASIVGLNLLQIVPAVLGIRPGWASTGGLFGLSDFYQRSLNAYSSLLGFGREIGYLGFTGQQTWYSNPYAPLVVYRAAAVAVAGLAFAALWRRRDARTVFLVATAVVATFMAKGFRLPMGTAYLWAIHHVPVFDNLRTPNRWLIPQALAYAVLAPLTLRWLVDGLATRPTGPIDARTRRRTSLAIGLALTLFLLPVAPTIVTGFRTWSPAPGQLALLEAIRQDPSAFELATVPYDQSMRFVDQNGYRGYEHDLGAEAAAFAGHPALGDGGWSQRSAAFIAYTSSLLKQGDPAFQQLLGAVGVKYLVNFNYPATAPHLVDPGAGPLYQQQAIQGMPGFLPIAADPSGTLSRLSSWTPRISFRPNVAVVLGGPSGYAALADQPGVHMQDWAAVSAADALAAGGVPELGQLIRQANLVVVSNSSLRDLAVVASPPVCTVPGITSDPGLDRKTQLVPSDASIRTGSLADPSAPIPEPGRSSQAGTFTVTGAPRQLDVWSRIQVSPSAARLRFSVDGRTVGSVTPVGVDGGGFRWVRVATGTFAPGSHVVSVTATRSLFGRSFEVDETRVIDPTQWSSALSDLTAALRSAASRTLYSFDLQDGVPWSSGGTFGAQTTPVGSAPGFWHAIEPSTVTAPSAQGPGGSPSLSVSIGAGRAYYTLLRHDFAAPQNWADRPYLFLPLSGSGSGNVYEVVVRFPHGEAHYVVRDDWSGWRTLAFSPGAPDRVLGSVDWSRVTSVRVALDSKTVGARLGVGSLQLGAPRPISLSFPVLPSNASRQGSLAPIAPTGTVPSGSGIAVSPRSSTVSFSLPLHAVEKGGRLLIPPTSPIHESPAVPVVSGSAGNTDYRLSFHTSRAGALVFDQGYDPRWTAHLDGQAHASIPILSTVNGYLLPPGTYSGTVSYSGRAATTWSWWMSLAALAVLIAIAIGIPASRRALATAAGAMRRFMNEALRSARRTLGVAVAGVVVGAIVISTVGAWARASDQRVDYRWPENLTSDPATFWSGEPGNHVTLTKLPASSSVPAARVTLGGKRPYYTIVGHAYGRPQNWLGRRTLFLDLRGDGQPTAYRLVVDFDVSHHDSVSFPFRLSNAGWTTVPIDLWHPPYVQGSVDWRHVVSVRIAGDDRARSGSLTIGPMSLSGSGA